FIAQGAASRPTDHALACLLGLLGLRVSEACGVDIEHLSTERGHRTVTVLGKGHKLAVIPMPPRVARAVDQACGDRLSGAVLLTRTGGGWTVTPPPGSSGDWRSGPGSRSTSRPTRSGTASS